MVPITLIHWSWEDAFDPAGFNEGKGWNGLDLVVAFLESIGCTKIKTSSPTLIKSFVYQGKHREIDTMPKALRALLDEHFNSRYVVNTHPSGVQAPQ
jgi:hypothetical protein